MRVLHVIPSVAAVHGGPSHAVQLMKRSLIGRVSAVEIACTDDDGPGRRKAKGDIPADHVFPKRTEFYKLSPALGAWLNRHAADYDLLHIHALFSYSSIAAARAARRAGVPYIVRPLGTLTRYGIQQRRPWLKQASLRWLDGPALRHAAAVHFTAQAEWDEARLLGIPMRQAIVPLAVDDDALPDVDGLFNRFPALTGRPYALFLSRLDPKKNVEALLDAMHLLRNEHPELQLAIVGDGAATYVEQLKQQATTLGIHDRVVWMGFLSGGLKAAVLQQATLFALPSYSENFGIAAAEALLAGLPCVLGQGVAIAKDVQAAGAGLAAAPTARTTADAMKVYLADAVARQMAGAAAKHFARSHYSLDAMGSRLVDLYRAVLQHRGQPLLKGGVA